jgi:hypothetical protein
MSAFGARRRGAAGAAPRPEAPDNLLSNYSRPREPCSDEAPDGVEAALAARPGDGGADRGHDDGDGASGGVGRNGRYGVEAVTVEDGVDHPHARGWRGGAHRAR